VKKGDSGVATHVASRNKWDGMAARRIVEALAVEVEPGVKVAGTGS